MGVAAQQWGAVVVLGVLLSGGCGDDFVGATDTDGSSGSSTGDTTEGGTVPTSTNPTTTEPTTDPPPTTDTSTTTTTETTVEPTGPSTETDTTSPVTLTTMDTDTSTTDTTATDTDTDTDTTITDTDTTDTGDELVGRSVSQTVNGGTKASSANFTMVFTLGQPTQNQGVYQSENFRLQGGLIGANGNPP
jgi:hypothetical protein